MAILSHSIAFLVGLIAALGSPIVGAVIMLSAALTLHKFNRRQVVVGALLPAFAVGRVALNLLKYTSDQ